ncbi:MAG: prephenate dehydrogenase/arogenate dehydrogenase family protein [Calditrichaeota bacterium]|nr:MAG: prephenate dehydrogenase/arogenate dehydrogenase family protein [Calditrichota bacterium]
MAKRIISKITICGYGLIGGCIALDILKRYKSVEITAFDRKGTLDSLRRDKLHKVRAVSSFAKAVENADIIILAAPHKANETNLEKLSKIKTLTDCLIIDTGAVKTPITKLAKNLKFAEGTQFLPTHPMAGREKAGFKNASDKLFKNHAWYLSEDILLNDSNKKKIDWLIRAVQAMRVEVSSQLHDELVSEISHLPQLISTILGGQINPNLIQLAGPGLRSMLRLSGSPYSVWSEIISENKTEIIKTLLLYKNNLNKVIEKIKKDESLEDIFKDSSRSYRCL